MAVATPCVQFPHSSTTTMSSCKKPFSNDAVLLFRSTFLGTTSSSSKSYRTTFEVTSKHKPSSSSSSSSLSSIVRACSASFDDTSDDEEISKKIHELAFRFQVSDQIFSESQTNFSLSEEEGEKEEREDENILLESSSFMEIQSLNLPLSRRMIKMKKKQWKENLIEVKESAYCSVNKAFSSMVFIIRELHSYTLQMREILFYEDLQGILARVQSEMHASFVWLFQQVFSHTPTLMVYVMILLANFTVHSISTSAAITIPPPVATVEQREITTRDNFDFDASAVITFTVSSSPSSSGSKTTAIDGDDGGSNVRPVASGMDGDGWMNSNSGILHRPILPDGVSPVNTREEESEAWKSIVREASRMQSQMRDEALDDDTLQRFVSPVTAEIQADDQEDYFKTELLYQSGLAQEPDNVLLLANYAQFLYLVVHDFDRAEEYFKRAVKVEPKDAEAHSKYANFLWQVKNDLWAAEETFLEAISADPSNSYYAANYAHFLWNTGGEDTCFPLDSPDDESLDA